MKTRVSKKGSLVLIDYFKGLLIAAGTSALLVVQQSVDAGHLIFNWKSVSMAAIAGGVSYLLKNLLEPSKVITITRSATKAEQVKEVIDTKIA